MTAGASWMGWAAQLFFPMTQTSATTFLRLWTRGRKFGQLGRRPKNPSRGRVKHRSQNRFTPSFQGVQDEQRMDPARNCIGGGGGSGVDEWRVLRRGGE